MGFADDIDFQISVDFVDEISMFLMLSIASSRHISWTHLINYHQITYRIDIDYSIIQQSVENDELIFIAS